MELKKLTGVSLISIDSNFKTKDEVIRHLVKKLAEAGKLQSEEEFYKAVMERESLTPTGFEAGLAVPHGKSKTVKEASFAVAKLKKPIEDWESVDENNKVELVFLLAIPEAEAGSTHIELLAELATRISDAEYTKLLKSSKSAKEFYENLGNYKKQNYEFNNVKFKKSIVAVTACPAGIAHTYMAAEALKKAGQELGVAVYVEKQGANGIEDPHTTEQLRNADAAIFAVEIAVKNEERYKHLPIYRTSVAAPLKNAKAVIEKALELSKTKTKEEYKPQESNKSDEKSFKTEIKNSLLTGISYIIPIIVAGGMISAFATIIAQLFGYQAVLAKTNSWLWMYKNLGGNMLSTLMVPVLSAYMAYSIADKPALGPGFAAGVAANLIGSGFLGGMLGGFLAGYIVKYMKKRFPAKGTFAGFISFWIYPVIGSLLVGTLMLLVVGPPVANLNKALIAWLGSLTGTNAAILGAVIGIFVSFDLGGPVNKAAYTFCIAAMASGNFIPYAAFSSVKMVSGFSVTAATTLFKKYYQDYEIEVGKSTWLLVLGGITEGAIPFMVEDPIRVIPSLCIGSAVTGAIVAVSHIGLSVPGAGIFSLIVLKGGSSLLQADLIWFGAAVLGAVISTALLVITRIQKLKKSPAKN
jgi:2-O-A-mannosyl-D-glycerate PTS system EIIABC component